MRIACMGSENNLKSDLCDSGLGCCHRLAHLKMNISKHHQAMHAQVHK